MFLAVGPGLGDSVSVPVACDKYGFIQSWIFPCKRIVVQSPYVAVLFNPPGIIRPRPVNILELVHVVQCNTASSISTSCAVLICKAEIVLVISVSEIRYGTSGVDKDFRACPVGIAAAESLPVAFGIIGCRGLEAIYVAVLLVLAEKFLAGGYDILPSLLRIIPVPDHMSVVHRDFISVGSRRLRHVEIWPVSIEARTGGK